MQAFKFENLMKDLAQLFTPLSDEQMEIYYNYFKDVPENIFEQAVEMLGKFHPYKRFPVPAEIEAAIREVYGQAGGDPGTKGCDECNHTGFKLVDGKARHCECETGQRIKTGNLQYLVSERMKK